MTMTKPRSGSTSDVIEVGLTRGLRTTELLYLGLAIKVDQAFDRRRRAHGYHHHHIKP